MNKFKKAMTLFAITGAVVINMAPIYTYANVSENEIAREEAEGPKGLAVRQLKRHASWVQNVVRQFGPYLSRALEI